MKLRKKNYVTEMSTGRKPPFVPQKRGGELRLMKLHLPRHCRGHPASWRAPVLLLVPSAAPPLASVVLEAGDRETKPEKEIKCDGRGRTALPI